MPPAAGALARWHARTRTTGRALGHPPSRRTVLPGIDAPHLAPPLFAYGARHDGKPANVPQMVRWGRKPLDEGASACATTGRADVSGTGSLCLGTDTHDVQAWQPMATSIITGKARRWPSHASRAVLAESSSGRRICNIENRQLAKLLRSGRLRLPLKEINAVRRTNPHVKAHANILVICDLIC